MLMKRVFLALLVVVMGMPAMAQENALWRNAFTAGVSYGFNVRDADMDFNGVAINGGYRKFLYCGLFVMPEVSLYWQKYDWETVKYIVAETTGAMANSPMRIEDKSIDRFGVGADVLLGVRIPVKEKVGIDLMVGPYIEYSFAGNDDREIYDYDNFEIRCRFAVGISVLDKISVTATYDVGKTKFMDYHSDKGYRGNIMSVGLGYTF